MLLPLRKGIKGQLAASSALITALGGTAIYRLQAPPGAALPYVIFSLNAGGDANVSPRDESDTLWLVKAVDDDATTAGSIADLIRTTLHDADLTLDGGWTAYRCQHTQIVEYVENIERRQYFHSGGLYRIRAHE